MEVNKDNLTITFKDGVEMAAILGYARNGALLHWKNEANRLLSGSNFTWDFETIDGAWKRLFELQMAMKEIKNEGI